MNGWDGVTLRVDSYYTNLSVVLPVTLVRVFLLLLYGKYLKDVNVFGTGACISCLSARAWADWSLPLIDFLPKFTINHCSFFVAAAQLFKTIIYLTAFVGSMLMSQPTVCVPPVELNGAYTTRHSSGPCVQTGRRPTLEPVHPCKGADMDVYSIDIQKAEGAWLEPNHGWWIQRSK